MSRGFGFVALLVVSFGLISGCSGGDDAVPPFEPTVTSSTTSIAGASTTTVSVAAFSETVEDFLDGYVGAHRTGNPVFLIQRIHPKLREYYGREACRDLYGAFIPDDTADITIRTTSGPTVWSDVFDGVEFSFQDVYTVDVEIADFGWTRREDLRLVKVDDRFYLLQDCGDPITTTTTTVPIEQLDPDGDGFYYVHRGSGDSEDFVVPAEFRITYTGLSSTCGFQLLNSETRKEIRYVAGLDGGGIKRLILSDPLTTAYISDVLGCFGGALQVGPNP